MLGGIFLRPALLAKLVDLEADDFALAKHQAVWSAMLNLAAVDQPIDEVTVAGELERQGKARMFSSDDTPVGAMSFCATLTLRVPSVENVLEYARTIQEHRGDRDARQALLECVVALDSPDRDDMRGDGFVQWARMQLGKLKLRGAGAGSLPIARVVNDRVKQYDAIHEAKERGVPLMLGIPTGVVALDHKIGGWQRGIPTVLAGRPRMGKSSVLRLAADAASRANIGAHTFSVEDRRSAFADRTISSESGVPIEILRTGGTIKRDELYDLGTAINRLKLRQRWLIDDSTMTASQIVARWRRHGEENETKLVTVDYLQRLRKSDPRMSDFDHVTESMSILGDAAKDDDVACIIGSQLNRECEKRDDKRPTLADLRAGGTIEEIAKCIVAVYRGSVYGPPEDGDDQATWDRRMELIVLKHNDGSEGTVIARWDGPTTTVS